MSTYTLNGIPTSKEFTNERGMASYISSVYGWMFIGLMLTAVAAFYAATDAFILNLIFGNAFGYIVLILIELALVMTLSAKVHKLSFGASVSMFLIYSIINGLTLSVIFLVYNLGMIFQAFGISAAAFGIMAIYGHITKKDLTSIGKIFIMGLIGLILLSLTHIIMSMFGYAMSGFEILICVLGLIIFLGLTAYDAQKLKAYYNSTEDNEKLRNNLKIHGALTLYLDFINIFLYILRLLGRNNK